MKSRVFAGAAALTVSGLLASPALAGPATTQPATGVTATSAVLHGTTNTSGQKTTWVFQYGKTRSYGKSTPTKTISAGGGVVPVSAQIKSLAPNTTYHFRLVIRTVGPSPYDIKTFFGNDMRFRTTSLGSVNPTDKKLTVSRGKVSIALLCASPVGCGGVVTITKKSRVTVRPHGRTNTRTMTLQCAKTTFGLAAHERKTLVTKVRGACLTLLDSASNHQIGARLRITPRTGQRGADVGVTLMM
jgi:hypothetical protein